ncbi:MAG: ATP-binding protein [Clostridia bacterium]|nr:ATP-binding protein [Clostridia bacterium]
MKNEKMQKQALSLSGLAVFAGLLKKPLFSHFLAFCRAECTEQAQLCYAAFVGEIYDGGTTLAACVKKALFEDENAYVRARAEKRAVPPSLAEAAEAELEILSAFASLTPDDFKKALEDVPYLAPFAAETVDFAADYEQRMCDIHRYGYGIFAAHGMFRLSDGKHPDIEPILSPDPVSLSSFIGYEEERGRVVENTRAFLSGRPAANILLYGDAGTGKSSTVKAVANHFYDEGLRLIEIRKDQLSLLPLVMGRISGNPLRFIIFIDDLSFNQSDDCFSMLKAALEGSAAAKAPNAVIYATSNRRHIVRESFADREGGDVHRNDTLQETLSLSERFGMTVLFSRPNRQLYLEIIRELAQKHRIPLDITELEVKAEAFALARGTRSARCAEQFIESLM